MAESFSSLDNPFLLEYRDTLSGGADYFDINDVDNVDDYYDTEDRKSVVEGKIVGLGGRRMNISIW